MPASFKPAVELLESRSLLSTVTATIATPNTVAAQVQSTEAMSLFRTVAARVQTLNMTPNVPGSSVSNIAPNLLPQNALPGAIFASIRIPGTIAASYEGSGGAEALQIDG